MMTYANEFYMLYENSISGRTEVWGTYKSIKEMKDAYQRLIDINTCPKLLNKFHFTQVLFK